MYYIILYYIILYYIILYYIILYYIILYYIILYYICPKSCVRRSSDTAVRHAKRPPQISAAAFARPLSSAGFRMGWYRWHHVGRCFITGQILLSVSPRHNLQPLFGVPSGSRVSDCLKAPFPGHSRCPAIGSQKRDQKKDIDQNQVLQIRLHSLKWNLLPNLIIKIALGDSWSSRSTSRVGLSRQAILSQIDSVAMIREILVVVN